MINIQKKSISALPVLEVVKNDLSKEILPTVFFYHGWEGYKEKVLEEAYRLADQDLRVLLPDVYNHGERKKTQNQDPMAFWEIIMHTTREFPILVDAYLKENKIAKDRIGVAGLSMGGILTSTILTQFDWVKSAAVLMGSPAPIALTKWMLENNSANSGLTDQVKDPNFVEEKLRELSPISLNLHPEKIAGRSMYFWHGIEDEVVPVSITKAFVEEHQKTQYGENIKLELSAGVGHKVPGKIIKETADYFAANL